jgi:hypothetical protein
MLPSKLDHEVFIGSRLCSRKEPHYHEVKARSKKGSNTWISVCKIGCQGGNQIHADVVADLIDSHLGVKTEVSVVKSDKGLVSPNQILINPKLIEDFRDFQLRCGSHELWVEAPWDLTPTGL